MILAVNRGDEISNKAFSPNSRPKNYTERRNTMSTKSTGFFKKLLGTVLSATCVFSGTALASGATLTASAASTDDLPAFSWDNASVYFLLTDRFNNGNPSNDHAYGRGCDANGNALSGYKTEAAFQGGDFAGITQKISEGYFNDLGVNAIWLSAPYEQIHGYVVGGSANPSYLHYSYHGYYVLDYTEPDLNFGTREEFQTMVDTAHEHGIRIVLDIVMNHAGYNDLKTMSDYSFGSASGWESYYYSHQNTNNIDYHGFIDYTSQSAWAKWWGSDWIRCGLPGYSAGSGEVAGSLEGLPDFKTESGTTVGIPEVLKTKWNKEGTYAAKVAKYGDSGTVRSYLVKWLTEWVKQYGVDGFRCDTAKHVEMESWKALKDEGKASLKQWRQNNPTKPGADWTDEFWMTGECFGHGPDKSNYFTSGAFDSMINFAFTAVGSCNVPAAGSVEGVYSSYASKFNNDPTFNMLSYLASHDTTLITGDRNYAGSFLLMCPGGIQIYYGDEINRPLAQVSSDSTNGAGHKYRSFMNWSSMDQSVLSHWQKVGQFRNNHLSVGAGAHQVISAYSGDDGYTFSRTYSKNGIDDKVVVTLFAGANKSLTVDVSSVFSDGTEVTNFYDGTTAKVSGGKVTFNTGANGTLLLQEPNGKKGRVVVTHINKDTGATIKTETMSGLIGDSYTVQELSQEGFKVASIDGSKTGTYSETEQQVTIYYTFDSANYGYIVTKYVDASTGEEIADSETKTAKVGTTYTTSPKDVKNYEVDLTKTTNATGTVKSGTTTVTYQYNFVQPTNLVVHYYNANNWSTVNLYAYDKSGSSVKEYTGKWPGKAMTAEGDGWFVCDVTEAESATVIFNNGSGAQEPPGVGTPGYDCSGEVWIKNGKPVSSGKVKVIYTTTDGTILATQTITGVADGTTTYKTEEKTFSGYTLKETPSNASGVFTAQTITVTYVYESNQPAVLTNTSTISTTSIEAGSSVTVNGSAKGGTPPYQFAFLYKSSSASSYTTAQAYSTTSSATITLKTAGTYTVLCRVKDNAGAVAEQTFSVSVEGGQIETLVNKSTLSASSITLGKSVTVTGKATGGETPYQYAYYYKKSTASSYTTAKTYSTSATCTIKPTAVGKYTVLVKVKDGSGTVARKELSLTVTAAELTNNSTVSATSIALGNSVTIKGAAAGGTSPYQYAYYYRKSTSTSYTTIKSYSSSTSATVTPASATKYTILVKVKDSKSKVASKTFEINVIKKTELKNTSKLAATTVTLGSYVTVNCSATGGTAPYQYSVSYKKSTSSSYTSAQSYSTNATVKFKPGSAAKYTVLVKVKDKAGTVKYDTYTVTVTKVTELTNTSKLGATSIKLGSTAIVYCSATGGTAPYQYSVSYKKSTSDSYTSAQSYSTNAKVKFTPGSATTYTVLVKVKDSKGTMKYNTYTLKVTK